MRGASSLPARFDDPARSYAPELAPVWHTASLIALMLAVAATGAIASRRGVLPAAPASARITAIYLPTIVVAWVLLLYVCRVGRPRNALPLLLGEKWRSVARASTDVALALAGWLLILACELAWTRLFASGAGAPVAAMLPYTPLERVAWVLVALSVGFSEEVVFRGYLQTQLGAFSGRASVGVALQAALFGIAHGEQGAGAMVRIALYGALLGALARWRRSLLPGIVCHIWTDLASGIVHLG